MLLYPCISKLEILEHLLTYACNIADRSTKDYQVLGSDTDSPFNWQVLVSDTFADSANMTQCGKPLVEHYLPRPFMIRYVRFVAVNYARRGAALQYIQLFWWHQKSVLQKKWYANNLGFDKYRLLRFFHDDACREASWTYLTKFLTALWKKSQRLTFSIRVRGSEVKQVLQKLIVQQYFSYEGSALKVSVSFCSRFEFPALKEGLLRQI